MKNGLLEPYFRLLVVSRVSSLFPLFAKLYNYMIRVQPYYRRSRRDKERGISIDIQREVCERLALQHPEWELLPALVDDGKSAYTDNLTKRPAFQDLLSLASQRKCDLVIVYKYDRFARKMAVYSRCISDMEALGINVLSATEGDDWLLKQLSGVIAEQYSRILSGRMKDVRRWEAQQGKLVGPVPVGYERVDKRVVPSAEADAVRLAGKLYATGDYSAAHIAQALNEAGYRMPNGVRFKKTSVEEFLHNPLYAGIIVYDGKEFPAQHEPLWDAALWQRLRAVAQKRSRQRPRSGNTPKPLLAGFIRCASCGDVMWYNASGHGRYYRCRVAKTHGDTPYPTTLLCNSQPVNADVIEIATFAWCAGLALTPGMLDTARRLMDTPTAPVVDVAVLDEKIRRLARAYADGAYSDEEYQRRRTSLIADRDRAQFVQVVPREDPAQIIDLLQNLPALLHEATTDECRAVLRELVTDIYVRGREVYAFRPTRLAQVLWEAGAARGAEWLTNGRQWAGRELNQQKPIELTTVPSVLLQR